MQYHRIPLQLNNPLGFWQNFEGEERVFWVDRQSDITVVGAKRLGTVKNDEDRKNYAYIFYGGTFFKEPSSPRWEGFDGEMVAFQHYYIIEKGQAFYLYTGEPVDIYDYPVFHVNHDYQELASASDYGRWEILFKGVQEAIHAGQVKKVVGSREVAFHCCGQGLEGDLEKPSNLPEGGAFYVPSILDRLVENNPGCFIFAYEKNGKTFLGASPEILVRHRGHRILSYALAGTYPKDGTSAHSAQALLEDPKNVYEHNLVADRIVATMEGLTQDVGKGDMGILELKNLYHLRTIIEADDGGKSLMEWGHILHPTPALGGEPRQAALPLIRQLESYDRGMYAAPFGFMKDMGDGILVVAIRSALVEGDHLYAYAGCGLVEGSDCREEYEETKNKMRTILEAL